MNDRFYIIEEIRRKSKRSWKNIYQAARKEIGADYEFGTGKVEASSTSILRKMVNESGMSGVEIMNESEKRIN